MSVGSRTDGICARSIGCAATKPAAFIPCAATISDIDGETTTVDAATSRSGSSPTLAQTAASTWRYEIGPSTTASTFASYPSTSGAAR